MSLHLCIQETPKVRKTETEREEEQAGRKGRRLLEQHSLGLCAGTEKTWNNGNTCQKLKNELAFHFQREHQELTV